MRKSADIGSHIVELRRKAFDRPGSYLTVRQRHEVAARLELRISLTAIVRLLHRGGGHAALLQAAHQIVTFRCLRSLPEQAIKFITYDTATHWGFHDRGLVREGMAADLVVFDPQTVGPRMPEVVTDLPAGAKRLKQTCDGMRATVVNGQVLLRDNQHTGALPGRLLRGHVPG